MNSSAVEVRTASTPTAADMRVVRFVDSDQAVVSGTPEEIHDGNRGLGTG